MELTEFRTCGYRNRWILCTVRQTRSFTFIIVTSIVYSLFGKTVGTTNSTKKVTSQPISTTDMGLVVVILIAPPLKCLIITRITIPMPSLKQVGQLLNKRTLWDKKVHPDTTEFTTVMDQTLLPRLSKKGQWCSKNQKGWNLVNQTYTPIFGESKKRASTDSVFNETLQFLEDQLNAAQAAGLSGLDALDFIEMAECQNSPPLEITPVLEAWVKMNQGSLSSYDRICDNSSARFCATFPNSELCQEEEEEEEITTLTFESRTLEVIVIAEAVIIVILLIFGITSYCVKQQGVVRVDDVGYVQMGKV